MQTSAFITYLSERVNNSYTRPRLLELVNIAQNEILSHDNGLTEIKPTPFLHTGSDSFTSHNTLNAVDSPTFKITVDIPLTTPKSGWLNVDSSGYIVSYKYDSFSGDTFTLADGQLLVDDYTSQDTASVDRFRLTASGALFSPFNNSQSWDVRFVRRVRMNSHTWFNRAQFNRTLTRRPDFRISYEDETISVSADLTNSIEPLSNDAEIVLWYENDPGISSDSYICDAFKWPTQVLTESVPLTIPSEFQTNLLFYAIIRGLEYSEYGKNDHSEKLYKEYLYKFLSKYPANEGSEDIRPRAVY